jgi:peptidyl-prolyl cis-trans isomerase C
MFLKYKALAIAVILTIFSPAFGLAEDKKDSSEKIIAIVNQEPLTYRELIAALNPILKDAEQQGNKIGKQEIRRFKGEVREKLIDWELLIQESRKLGIVVKKSEVDSKIRMLKKQLVTREKFEEALKEMNISEIQLRNRIRRIIGVQLFIRKIITQEIQVSEKEIKDFYYDNPNMFKQPKQVRASHILIKVNADTKESKKNEARKKLEDIRARILKGEDFGLLAKKFSECPSGTKGGDLGYFSYSQMVKPFSDSAFELKPDKVSEIVETQYGYHLIKATGKKNKITLPFKEVKAKLHPIVKQKKDQEAIMLYMKKLKETAEIKRLPIPETDPF